MKQTTYNPAPLFGLVLAGGKSTRMGRDKGMIDWHGQPQRYFLADILAGFCKQVFISCRADQVAEVEAAGYKALPDSHEAKAQFGAILSAMGARPEAAWLVVACDLPLIDKSAIKNLIKQRDTSKLATAYSNPENGLPEPLAAIWEPRAEAMLLQKFKEGIDCPRKSLIRSAGKVKLVEPASAEIVMNVNTPEAAETAKQLITNYAS